MNTLLKLLVYLCLFSNCHNHRSISRFKIIPAPLLTDIQSDSVNSIKVDSRFDYFLVRGDIYKSDKDSLESYAKYYMKDSNNFYHHYEIVFLKETKALNLKTIEKMPERFRWKLIGNEQPITTFLWIDGKYTP